MSDLANLIHRAIYGRSDKANSPCNQSAEWQAADLIEMEWRRRDYCAADESNFKEWKRGMWAATMQRIL